MYCTSPAGDDEDARTDLECAELDLGDETLSRGEHSGSNAKFWEGLLKERHQQLLKEEEQQVQEQWRSHHLHSADASPALDPAGMDSLSVPLIPVMHVWSPAHGHLPEPESISMKAILRFMMMIDCYSNHTSITLFYSVIQRYYSSYLWR